MPLCGEKPSPPGVAAVPRRTGHVGARPWAISTPRPRWVPARQMESGRQFGTSARDPLGKGPENGKLQDRVLCACHCRTPGAPSPPDPRERGLGPAVTPLRLRRDAWVAPLAGPALAPGERGRGTEEDARRLRPGIPAQDCFRSACCYQGWAMPVRQKSFSSSHLVFSSQ